MNKEHLHDCASIISLYVTGGITTKEDLQAYTAAVKPPLQLTVHGDYTVLSTPPPSSGAVLLLILNILSGNQFDDNLLENILIYIL